MSNPIADRNRPSVPETILAALRSQIMRGEIAPGDRLPPERELAKQFGTNRTSLREALRTLQAQGLVQARQGDGVRVLNFRQSGEIGLLVHYFTAADPTEQLEIIMELMRVRVVLLPEVIGRAAQRATDEQLKKLVELVDQLEHAYLANNTAAMADIELHCYRQIIQASHSLTYLWVYNSFEKIVRGFLTAQPQMWLAVPGFMERWRGIGSALRIRDAERADEHFQALVVAVEEQISMLLKTLRGSNRS